MDYSIYLVLAPFTGAVVLILLVLIVQRSQLTSARYLALFVASALGFLIANYLELRSASDAWKLAWAEVEHVWAALLPLAWILFVFDFTELTAWKRFRRFWPLCIPGLVDVALTFTNSAHHLIWRSVSFVPVAGHVALRVEHGSVYIALLLVYYVMYVAGLLLVQRQLRESFGLYRRQLLLLALGILIPMAFNVIYITGVVPGLHKDFTAIGFGLAAIVFVASMRSARFLEIIPASRSQIFNVLQDGIVVVDGRKRIVDLNQAAMALLGLDESSLGQSAYESAPLAELLERWDGDAEALSRDVTLRRDDRELHYELQLRRRGGVRSRGASAIIGVHDVTERLRMQKDEVLLKEIHHRVKNNLQVISSLLYLQESRVKDASLRTVLNDCRSQILSMALIHEDLYRSKDFDNIDFGEYLKELTHRLLVSFRAERRVALELRLEQVPLDIESAIPCGLIVNELCVNALKYAFPPTFLERPPALRIELNEAAGQVRISVADNGIGFPGKLERIDSASLGMQIVQTLTRQLHGSLQLDGSGGTRFTITFPRGNGRDHEGTEAHTAIT